MITPSQFVLFRLRFNMNHQKHILCVDHLISTYLYIHLLPSFNVSFTNTSDPIPDPEGIANAQKSLGLGQEEKARRVR